MKSQVFGVIYLNFAVISVDFKRRTVLPLRNDIGLFKSVTANCFPFWFLVFLCDLLHSYPVYLQTFLI